MERLAPGIIKLSPTVVAAEDVLVLLHAVKRVASPHAVDQALLSSVATGMIGRHAAVFFECGPRPIQITHLPLQLLPAIIGKLDAEAASAISEPPDAGAVRVAFRFNGRVVVGQVALPSRRM